MVTTDDHGVHAYSLTEIDTEHNFELGFTPIYSVFEEPGEPGDPRGSCKQPGKACNVFNEFCCSPSWCFLWFGIGGVRPLSSCSLEALTVELRTVFDALTAQMGYGLDEKITNGLAV
jgi:hypothetical protein